MHVRLIDNAVIRLYYEDQPPAFVQMSKSRFPYNPDFVLELECFQTNVYVIMDAKYKNYDSVRLQEDLAKLTLNYLHKIGPNDTTNDEFIGLFTISLSSVARSHVNSIFRSEYSLFSQIHPIHRPQIGSIEIMPKFLDVSMNPFVSVLKFMFKVVEEVSGRRIPERFS